MIINGIIYGAWMIGALVNLAGALVLVRRRLPYLCAFAWCLWECVRTSYLLWVLFMHPARYKQMWLMSQPIDAVALVAITVEAVWLMSKAFPGIAVFSICSSGLFLLISAAAVGLTSGWFIDSSWSTAVASAVLWQRYMAVVAFFVVGANSLLLRQPTGFSWPPNAYRYSNAVLLMCAISAGSASLLRSWPKVYWIAFIGQIGLAFAGYAFAATMYRLTAFGDANPPPPPPVESAEIEAAERKLDRMWKAAGA